MPGGARLADSLLNAKLKYHATIRAGHTTVPSDSWPHHPPPGTQRVVGIRADYIFVCKRLPSQP